VLLHEIAISYYISLLFQQNLSLDYMTKTLNQIIFFFLHQNQNIFFSNIGNQNIFLEKTHNPHPPFKINGRSLSYKLKAAGVGIKFHNIIQNTCMYSKTEVYVQIDSYRTDFFKSRLGVKQVDNLKS
jgi:hypothetical protein